MNFESNLFFIFLITLHEMNIKSALISVSDKTNIVDFSKKLASYGIRLLATRGTANFLSKSGLDVIEISDYTNTPEILNGRVKTLHHKIYGGLLARRDNSDDLNEINQQDIICIDILVVNLYPFVEKISDPNCSLNEAIEKIDIGGTAMLRAAAKNYGTQNIGGVTAIVDSADYSFVLEDIEKYGIVSHSLRLKLAAKAYMYTAAYDTAISSYLSKLINHSSISNQNASTLTDLELPKNLFLQIEQKKVLRYGENPHQKAAIYIDSKSSNGLINDYYQMQGKELSYNNIIDIESAWECVKSINSIACVIVKHANPCGSSIGKTVLESYQKAFKADPKSAFGGIIAFNRKIDSLTAQTIMNTQFLEILVAPDYSESALSIFSKKKNICVLKMRDMNKNFMDIKYIGGNWLIQTHDTSNLTQDKMRIVTKRQPIEQEISDMLFAWNIVKYTKSNAVVFVKNGMTIGIGAGQMSRLDSTKLADLKAKNSGFSLKNSVLASDGFFPFCDALTVAIEAGAICIIQPGGSINDNSIIKLADKYGITMVTTGIRHFRH